MLSDVPVPGGEQTQPLMRPGAPPLTAPELIAWSRARLPFTFAGGMYLPGGHAAGTMPPDARARWTGPTSPGRRSGHIGHIVLGDPRLPQVLPTHPPPSPTATWP